MWQMVKGRDGGNSGLALFAAELQAARSRAGLSREELAGLLNYSASLIGMIESLRRVPRLDFAERCDDVFGTVGTFVRLQQHARMTPLPSWFRPYAEIEAVASQVRSWEPSVIHGLLQTEDYARGVLVTLPNTTEGAVEERVTARMERQAILDRPNPPLLWAVLDEAVLHRQVGSERVMHQQLQHLAEMSLRPNVTIEVVPFTAEAHYGLLGAFAVADVGETARVAYLETVTQGYIVEGPAVVAEVMLTFDSLRSETLSRSASRDLITKRAEAYGLDQGHLA
jgi:transcriptional regulator with XRE-family HTH domain